MKKYEEYIIEIKDRKDLKLQPKPIEDAELLSEIILQIKDLNNKYRQTCPCNKNTVWITWSI